MKKILVLNGPNLNMLGIREPNIYGKQDYKALEAYINDWAQEFKLRAEIRQSNYEGELVTWIQQALGVFDGIILNAGAYTHTSVALLDALKAVGIPAVEVHISDVTSREDFRKLSFVRDACVKTVIGRGFEGYTEAIKFLQSNYGDK